MSSIRGAVRNGIAVTKPDCLALSAEDRSLTSKYLLAKSWDDPRISSILRCRVIDHFSNHGEVVFL